MAHPRRAPSIRHSGDANPEQLRARSVSCRLVTGTTPAMKLSGTWRVERACAVTPCSPCSTDDLHAPPRHGAKLDPTAEEVAIVKRLYRVAPLL